MQRLESQEALVVLPAGNNGEKSHNIIDTVPQVWNNVGSHPGRFRNLIVAGSVDTLQIDGSGGGISEFTSGHRTPDPGTGIPIYDDFITDVWAPGQVNCMSHTVNSEMVVMEGTSFAAGHVAGLAAYLLRAPNAPIGASQLKQRIIDLSHQRVIGGPRVVYNGVGQELATCIADMMQAQQVAHIGDHAKRDGPPACSFKTVSEDIQTTFLTVTGGLRGANPTFTGEGPSLLAKVPKTSSSTLPPPPPPPAPTTATEVHPFSFPSGSDLHQTLTLPVAPNFPDAPLPPPTTAPTTTGVHPFSFPSGSDLHQILTLPVGFNFPRSPLPPPPATATLPPP